MTLHVEPLKRAPDLVQLRTADEIECIVGGLTPREAMDYSIRQSLCSYEISVDGEVVAYWGYKPPSLLGPTCWAWMLTTPNADTYPVLVGLGSRRVLDSLLAMYPTVMCCVDPDHVVAMRWLEWLGFEPVGQLGRFTQMIAQRKEDADGNAS